MRALFVVQFERDVNDVYMQLLKIHGEKVYIKTDECCEDGICVVYNTSGLDLNKWDIYNNVLPNQTHANIIDHGGMCLDPAMGPVEEIGDWSLEEKEKIQDRIEQRKKDNKELKDIECSKCHRTYKAAHTCPWCGFKRKQKSEQLEYYEADLKRIKSSSLTKEDKQKIWNDALWVAKYRNSKVGAASHIYRQKVGCWPKGLNRLPKGPQWQMSAADFLAATR